MLRFFSLIDFSLGDRPKLATCMITIWRFCLVSKIAVCVLFSKSAAFHHSKKDWFCLASFILTPPMFKRIQKLKSSLEASWNISRQGAVIYLISMIISILGILGLWVFWAGIFWVRVFCPATVFQSTENFEILLGGGDHNFVSQCRKFCEVNYSFVLQSRKTCGVPPVYAQLFETYGSFSVQGTFLWLFWLVVFFCEHQYFKASINLSLITGLLKLLVRDAIKYLISMAFSILGILALGILGLGISGFWVFWAWVFCPATKWKVINYFIDNFEVVYWIILSL